MKISRYLVVYLVDYWWWWLMESWDYLLSYYMNFLFVLAFYLFCISLCDMYVYTVLNCNEYIKVYSAGKQIDVLRTHDTLILTTWENVIVNNSCQLTVKRQYTAVMLYSRALILLRRATSIGSSTEQKTL